MLCITISVSSTLHIVNYNVFLGLATSALDPEFGIVAIALDSTLRVHVDIQVSNTNTPEIGDEFSS